MSRLKMTAFFLTFTSKKHKMQKTLRLCGFTSEKTSLIFVNFLSHITSF